LADSFAALSSFLPAYATDPNSLIPVYFETTGLFNSENEKSVTTLNIMVLYKNPFFVYFPLFAPFLLLKSFQKYIYSMIE